MYNIFYQAEDGIRDLVRSRGLGDVYKRQHIVRAFFDRGLLFDLYVNAWMLLVPALLLGGRHACLLYTSDAADERSSVDLGGRRIIKKKYSSDAADARTSVDLGGRRNITHRHNTTARAGESQH